MATDCSKWVEVIIFTIHRATREGAMPVSPKDARDLAARALCRFDGNPEDIQFEGNPMWESYLPQADAVLEAIGWEPGGDDEYRRLQSKRYTGRRSEGGG